jgi:cyclase
MLLPPVMQQAHCVVPTGATRTRYAETPLYAEGLYDLGRQLYAWLVPNGSWGEANAGLILGDSEALLVDTLWDVPTTRAMLKALEAVPGALPPKYVVNTHADGDHFWGNELVDTADLITSQAAHEEMLTTRPASLLLLGKVGRLLSTFRLFQADKVGHWFQTMLKPYDFKSVTHTPARRAFTGTLTLTVGGRRVELLQVGPAHTHGDLLVYVPDAKIVYAGDIVFYGSTPVMWAGPIENYLAALDQILKLDVDLIVPGHGPLTDKEGVRAVQAYWEFMQAQLRQSFDAGLSASAAARAAVLNAEFARQPFAEWNSPERIMVSAHTQYRHWRGQTKPLKTLELLNIMRRQALLAYELPNAQPAIMRNR